MKKITNTWKLPAPPEGDSYEWHPVVRVGRHVPFGYKQDPEDLDILLPIPEELNLFEEAKKHLKQYSYRDVAAWLSEESGRYLSHVGLMKRVQIESKRKKEATNQRQLAEKYKKALQKAEKLEAQRLGGKSLRTPSNKFEPEHTE
jgi:hypothetical protein